MKYYQNRFLYIFCLILSMSIFANCNKSDGVNPTTPAENKNETRTAKYLINTIATIGVEEAQTDEDEPYQISSIKSVDCDKQGNIFILDNKSNCVRVFSQSGKFLRKMFSRGQGPKELVNSYKVRINPYSNLLFILNEHGFRLKQFDMMGNHLEDILLPGQIFGHFKFNSKDALYYVSDCKNGEDTYDNILELDISKKKITRGFLRYSIKERDDMFRHQQRLEILDNTLWTSTIDTMDLKGIDLSTGKVVKTIRIPGNFKKNNIFEASLHGNKILGLLAYNVAQPLLLNNRLFVLLIVQEYDFNRRPKWKAYSPTSCKLSLFQVLNNERIEKVTDLDQLDFASLKCTYKNRIIFSSHTPYPHIKIVEVNRVNREQ